MAAGDGSGSNVFLESFGSGLTMTNPDRPAPAAFSRPQSISFWKRDLSSLKTYSTTSSRADPNSKVGRTVSRAAKSDEVRQPGVTDTIAAANSFFLPSRAAGGGLPSLCSAFKMPSTAVSPAAVMRAERLVDVTAGDVPSRLPGAVSLLRSGRTPRALVAPSGASGVLPPVGWGTALGKSGAFGASGALEAIAVAYSEYAAA